MITIRGFVVTTYCLVGAGLAAQGARYLIASQFMHYHQEVVQERWSQLQPGERRLMLGLLKGFGAGMFCLGLGIIFIAVGPVRDNAYRAHWFIALLSVAYTGILVHVTRFALLPKAAPIAVTTTMLVMAVTAAIACLAF
jgi:hypothetical protein